MSKNKDEMRRRISKTQSDLRKKKKEEREQKRLSKFSPEYQKEMEKRRKKDENKRKRELRRAKTLTPAQKRFKEREAKGLSGLTGGKKGETMAEYRDRQKKQVQDAARKRNEAWKEAKKAKAKNKDKLKENTTKRKSRYNSPNRGISSIRR